ncbi:hypothetical protein Anapl_09194 [Anas platyrhynchos]|uniref:Uncharacterized protein n=1 Tax=Anas platyrhynchos TaxID=8839 RepID=R0KMW4_ANAPL|nr:hypothetical protein Anapl_09194 [Anas platyrhynchos]
MKVFGHLTTDACALEYPRHSVLMCATQILQRLEASQRELDTRVVFKDLSQLDILKENGKEQSKRILHAAGTAKVNIRFQQLKTVTGIGTCNVWHPKGPRQTQRSWQTAVAWHLSYQPAGSARAPSPVLQLISSPRQAPNPETSCSSALEAREKPEPSARGAPEALPRSAPRQTFHIPPGKVLSSLVQ